MKLQKRSIPFLVMALYFLSTSLILNSSWAIGADSAQKLYEQDSTSKIVQSKLLQDTQVLRSMKFTEFQHLNLESIDRAIRQLRFVIVDGQPLIGSGYRNGAVNLVEEQSILFNHLKFKDYSENQKTMLLWHEAWSAMGYDDDNYFLSVYIALKITQPELVIHPHIRQQFIKQSSQPLRTRNIRFAGEGGATGVGGGGDGMTAEVRQALISYINLLATKPENFDGIENTIKIVELAIETPIESLEFVEQYKSVGTYKRLSFGINKHTSQITILIDPREWIPLDRSGRVITSNHIELLNQIITVLEALKD
jgi:hypothetical protein